MWARYKEASMKKGISVIIVFLILNISIAAAAEDGATKSCQESSMEGTTHADLYHSSAGWWAGGVGSGVVLGLIGTGIVWGISMASNPQTSTNPEKIDENCYRQAYKNEAKGQNKTGAGVGGLIGTAVILVIFLSVNSN
jgi:hypothetical protein